MNDAIVRAEQLQILVRAFSPLVNRMKRMRPIMAHQSHLKTCRDVSDPEQFGRQ
jgi:hypothetical protein